MILKEKILDQIMRTHIVYSFLSGMLFFSKRTKAKVLVLFLISLNYSCALNLISPGINSNHRLDNKSFAKMLDMSFYGSYHYNFFAYFILPENVIDVLNDPNNFLETYQVESFVLNRNLNDIVILYEFCYNKEKDIDFDTDLNSYFFFLNGHSEKYKLVYQYPYSYKKIGLKLKLLRPFLVHKKYPNHQEIESTGYDYIMCYRNLLIFDTSTKQEGKNEFRIITPRENIQNFEFQLKNNTFQNYEKETWEMNKILRITLPR
ncbi:MAG: hypothetical protein O9301_04290 [Leptospira sp.]|nr:hypothetical protein [Leptospira sp.]